MVKVADVEKALETVHDPCSQFHGAEHSLPDLGMIAGIDIRGDSVQVRFLLDDPTCIFFFDLARRVEEAVGELDGVEHVEVTSDVGELWTEDRIRPKVREELQELRTRARERIQEAARQRKEASSVSGAEHGRSPDRQSIRNT